MYLPLWGKSLPRGTWLIWPRAQPVGGPAGRGEAGTSLRREGQNPGQTIACLTHTYTCMHTHTLRKTVSRMWAACYLKSLAKTSVPLLFSSPGQPRASYSQGKREKQLITVHYLEVPVLSRRRKELSGTKLETRQKLGQCSQWQFDSDCQHAK